MSLSHNDEAISCAYCGNECREDVIETLEFGAEDYPVCPGFSCRANLTRELRDDKDYLDYMERFRYRYG